MFCWARHLHVVYRVLFSLGLFLCAGELVGCSASSCAAAGQSVGSSVWAVAAFVALGQTRVVLKLS